MPRRRLLIVVADSFSPDQITAVRERKQPRIDFLEIARISGGDVLSYDSLRVHESGDEAARHYPHIRYPRPMLPAQPFRLKRCHRLLYQLAHAAHELSKDYDAILLTGEDLGIPLAANCAWSGKSAKIIAIGHYLNPLKKTVFFKYSRLGKYMDKLITYSPVQHMYCVERLGFPGQRVELIPFHADQHFYSPDESVERDPELIVAAGLEHRDYATLFKAVDGLRYRMELGIGSPWSRFHRHLPLLPKQTANRYRSRLELRDLYRKAGAVIVPLVNSAYQAGVSVLLESMSCGAPVIVARTLGLKHLLRDEQEGLYYPAGDAGALRQAILRLQSDPQFAAQIGRAARKKIEDMMTTNHFVTRLDCICTAAMKNSAKPEFYIIPNLYRGRSEE